MKFGAETGHESARVAEKVLHRFFIASKGKSVPLQAWSGPEGFRKLR